METPNINIETTNIETTLEPVNEEKYVGCVKWFNNKAGYGFVTITSENRTGSDIFVHHSAIRVKGEQYKYLVQGEYIEFNLIETNNSNHQFQAGNIYGINGGKLMCETRNEIRQVRNQYNSTRRVSSEQSFQTREQGQGQGREREQGKGRGQGQNRGRGRGRGQSRGQNTNQDSNTNWKYVSREHRRKPM